MVDNLRNKAPPLSLSLSSFRVIDSFLWTVCSCIYLYSILLTDNLRYKGHKDDHGHRTHPHDDASSRPLKYIFIVFFFHWSYVDFSKQHGLFILINEWDSNIYFHAGLRFMQIRENIQQIKIQSLRKKRIILHSFLSIIC